MGQQSWEPDPGTSRRFAGQVLQLKSRGRQDKTAKQPWLPASLQIHKHSGSPNKFGKLANSEGKQSSIALQQSSVPRPGSAAVMNPKLQQHSDPKVKSAIRAPAERAGQALPSASYNFTDLRNPWVDLCLLRASSSYFAFFMHFVFLFQLSCRHLLGGSTASLTWGTPLGWICWGTGITVNCHAGCSQVSPWRSCWTPCICSGWILESLNGFFFGRELKDPPVPTPSKGRDTEVLTVMCS